ncbi:MAG: hypothetical protein QG632_193 [Candidatus Dependentiae bacterium]|nr:hypothetical protein [Candidatus Dependentiae bacterium]
MVKAIFLLSNFICVLSFAADSPIFSPTGEPKSNDNSNISLDETLAHESFKQTQAGPAAQVTAPKAPVITPAPSMFKKVFSSITNLLSSAPTLPASTKKSPLGGSPENSSSTADEVKLSDITDFDPNTSLDENSSEWNSLNTYEEAVLTSLSTERAQAPTQEIESRNAERGRSTPEEPRSLDTSFNSPPVLLLEDFYAGKLTPMEKVRPAPGETASTREPANTPELASSATASPRLTTSPENDGSNAGIGMQTPQSSAAPGEATAFMTTVDHKTATPSSQRSADTRSLDYSDLTELPLTFSLDTTLHDTTLASTNKNHLSLNVSSLGSDASFLSKTSTHTTQDEPTSSLREQNDSANITESLSLCDVSSIEVVLSEGSPSDLSDFNDFNFNATLDGEESLVPAAPPVRDSAVPPTAADPTPTEKIHLARPIIAAPEQAIPVLARTPDSELTDAAMREQPAPQALELTGIVTEKSEVLLPIPPQKQIRPTSPPATQSPTRIATPVENKLTPLTLVTPREAIDMPAPLNISEAPPIPPANLHNKALLSPAPPATAALLITRDGTHQQAPQHSTANPEKQNTLTRRSIGAGGLALLAAATYQHLCILRLEKKLKNDGRLNQQESAQLNTLQKWRLGSGIGSGILLALTAYLYGTGKEKGGKS